MTDAELQAIADETGETIETVRDLAEAMAVCADEGPSEARADRRQRAREAVQDALAPNLDRLSFDLAVSSAEVAIETATRVRITPEIIDAAMAEPFITTYEALARAFRAAGFEVEQ